MNRGLRILSVRLLESGFVESGPNATAAYLYAVSSDRELMRHVVSVNTGEGWEYLQSIVGTDSIIDINQLLTNAKGYLYLATSKYGVIRTKDNGAHFDQILDLKSPKPDSFIQCMAIDRQQNLYAVAFPKKSISANIYRSTDDGDSWQKLPVQPPNGNAINKIIVADDGSICLGYNQDSDKVFRSSDIGQTWVPVLKTSASIQSNVDVMIHAAKGSDLYLNLHGPTYLSSDNGATWILQSSQQRGNEAFALTCDSMNNLFQCSIFEGVYSSSDKGVNWNSANNTLSVQFLVGGLTINSHGDMFCMSQFSIFRTTDQGDTWFTLPNPEQETFSSPLDATDHADNFYYGTFNGLFRSQDNGLTFDNVIKTHPPTNTNAIIAMGVSPKGDLFVYSDYEFFERSSDHGDTWLPVQGFPSAVQVYAIAFGSYNGTSDSIIVTTNTADIYLSTNDGETWNDISQNGVAALQLLWPPDGSIFMRNSGAPDDPNAGIFRSTDGGIDWSKVFPLDTSLHIAMYENIMLDNNGNILISTGDHGFYRSQNSNFTLWENLSSGFYVQDDSPDRLLGATEVVQNNQGVFFAASRGASVYKSTPDLGVLPLRPLSSQIAEPINYPNPFSRSTQIDFAIPNSGNVKVSIYDFLGRPVEVLHDGYMNTGEYTLSYDASTMISGGKYILVLRSGANVINHWMTVIK